MSYQPLWVRGCVVKDGDRACAERYEIVRAAVEPYRRTATVWDLGANAGYFGLRLASDFDVVSVMVEPRPVLAEACRLNGLPNTIAMTHRLTARDLQELAACEHADVVLCLNVLHHMHDWKDALDAVLRLGECVVIETPGRGDVASAEYERAMRILDMLEDLARPICFVPSHVTAGVNRPIFLLTHEKPQLSAGYAYIGRVRARGPHTPRPHAIYSTQDHKSIAFGKDAAPQHWHAGMNLWNWLQMGGAYPDRSRVQALVRAVVTALREPHGDIRPWNVILQGTSVQLIDGGHRQSVPDAQGLEETLAWIREPELAYVQ